MTEKDADTQDGFACPECGKVLPSEHGKQIHIGQVHGRPYHDEDVLRELYVEDGLSSMDIADKFGVEDNTIRDFLREFGIEIRSTKESHRRKIPKELRDEGKLRELYEDLDMRDAEIGDMLGVSQPTVTRWRGIHGIEGRENMSGPDHYAWKDNPESIDYGENWFHRRKEARERDNNTCQVCGFEPDGRNLDVHHIQPIKTFDEPEAANTLDNLITLCRSCHRKYEGIPIDHPKR